MNGKQLTVGVVGGEEVVLDKPMTPSEIQVGFFHIFNFSYFLNKYN